MSKTNTLVRWGKHSSLLEQLQQNIFQDLWNDPLFGLSRGWRPLSYKQTDKEYIVEIEVPRVKKSEISCEVIDDNSVSIKVDSSTIKYSQSFSFNDCDPSKATAEIESGVLTVKIPKISPPEPKVKKIEIVEKKEE